MVINTLQNYKRIEDLMSDVSGDVDKKIEVINSELSDLTDSIGAIDRELTKINTIRYQDLGTLTQTSGNPNPELTVDEVIETEVGSTIIGDTTYPVYRASFKVVYEKNLTDSVRRNFTINFPSTFTHPLVIKVDRYLLAKNKTGSPTLTSTLTSIEPYISFNSDYSINNLVFNIGLGTAFSITLFYSMLYIKEI